MSDALTPTLHARIRRSLVGMTEINGRATRSDFLFGFFILAIAGSVADWVVEWFSQGTRSRYDSLGYYAVMLLLITCLVRRLHDQDRSGWYALIVVPLLGMSAYGQYLFNVGELPLPKLGAPYSVINIVLVVVLWAMILGPGTTGINRYGPDPREMRPKRQ